MKLELILRLLDNEELSPEEVNDVKDFLDDYVDRNQVFSWDWIIVFVPYAIWFTVAALILNAYGLSNK